MGYKMNDPERCEKHQMIIGTCSICNKADDQSLLSEVFDAVNTETESKDDDAPAASDTAVILTRLCVRADCIHGGKFQEVGRFEGLGDVCVDCLSVTDLIKRKNMENTKPGRGRRWTDDDIEFLRLNVDKMRNKELGEHLGRTAAAVGFRLTANGIRRKKKDWKGKKNRKQKKSQRVDDKTSELKLTIDFTDHPDVLKALLDRAKEELREPALEVIYILRMLQRLGKDGD